MGRLLPPVDLDPPPWKPPPGPEPFVGVGLGRPRGPAALAVVDRTPTAECPDGLPRFFVSHLERFGAGVKYADVAAAAERVVAALKWPGCRLVVDAGHDEEALDAFRRRRGDSWFKAVRVVKRIGPAMAPDPRSDWLFIPGGGLASVVFVMHQEGRLELAGDPWQPDLQEALWAFSERAGETEEMGGPTFGREPGEEMVFAVALPVWWARSVPEYRPPPGPVPLPDLPPGARLRPLHGGAAERRGLFGAGGAGPDGYRPV